jgi:hypothetical protein
MPGLLPEDFGPQLQEANLQNGEHPMDLLELGETMITKYIEDAAPLMQPAAVESRVSGVIGASRCRATWICSISGADRRLEERPQAAEGYFARSSASTYELCDDYAGRKRRLPVGYRDEREDGQPDSKELLYQ